MDITPEPDLHPLYPSTAHVAVSLSSHSGLTPSQKSKLVQHCLTRACLFADISLLQYLLSDSSAQPHVDLSLRDDEGIGLVSLTIHGFGGDSDRDLDREEVVRLLVSQGADLKPDAGKTLAVYPYPHRRGLIMYHAQSDGHLCITQLCCRRQR